MHPEGEPVKRRKTFLLALGSLAVLVSVGTGGCGRGDSSRQSAKGSATSRTQSPLSSGEGNRVVSVEPTVDNTVEIQTASAALADARYDDALEMSRHALIRSPDDVSWIVLAARSEAGLGDLRGAIETLSAVSPQHPQAGLPSLGLTADWLLQCGDYEQAIRRYQQILAIDPTVNLARRQLASILNRLGRRQAAIEQLRELCLRGDIHQQELAELICCRLPAATERSGTGDSGIADEARRLLSGDQYRPALRLLQTQASRTDPVVCALLGRAAVEFQERSAIQFWWHRINDEQLPLSEHWYSLAVLVDRHLKDSQLAADLLAEAVLRDATDWVAFGILENLMNELSLESPASDFQRRVAWIKRSLLISNQLAGMGSPQPVDVRPLAEALDQLQRPLEANLWRYLALANSPDTPARTSQMAELQARHQELVQTERAFPDTASILATFPRVEHPLDKRREAIQRLTAALPWLAGEPATDVLPVDPSMVTEQPPSLAFRERAAELGLDFQYANAAPAKSRDFLIYEQFGGGVAILDFDRDGHCDVYFAQAAGEPFKRNGQRANALFRQVDHRFQNVTELASADDRSYSVNVTSGDLNQDGFDDIVVCNLGTNTIFINQGDGTFQSVDGGQPWNSSLWTSAMAIGDVNADQLPDVIEINYLDDPEILDVPPLDDRGRHLLTRGPESFQAAADRVLIQQSDASWQARTLADSHSQAAPGLGVVLANIDRQPGLEMFVANDTRANQLWMRDQHALAETAWVDVAKLRGCAFSASGGSGASMGVAAADFDGNGTLDFHVTNFYNEPNHLYLQNNEASFVDAVIPMGLHHASMPMLGFGTTSLDFENDGDMDLAIVNGHIEDLQFKSAPFKMKPQLFSNQRGSFQEMTSTFGGEHLDAYFSRPALGRGLVRCDWNGDGQDDLVATHLDSPAALLQNNTASGLAWLQIELVGTRCERSAVGAVVTVETDRGQWTQWLKSGDGYSGHEEPSLSFGLDSSSNLKRVTVDWPDAEQESWDSFPLNHRVLLVQGQPLWVR